MVSESFGCGHGRLLLETRFRTMMAEFTTWRMNDFIRQLEALKSRGRVLPFVRGLRLSAHLIYATRELLVGSPLTASWGHILDANGVFCSPECDVIIHRKDGQVDRWNGHEDPVMDFRFVSTQGAIAVISCKSQLKTIDSKYPESVKKYVPRVWLFTECCGPRSVKRLANEARQAGYEQFWHLYTWSPKTMPKSNEHGWMNFVQEVQRLQVACRTQN